MSHIQSTSGFSTCFHTSIRTKYLESCSVGAMSLPYLPKFISVLMRQVYSSCLVTQNSVWCGTVPCFFPSAINHQDFCSNLQQLLCGEFPFTTEDTTVKNPILQVQMHLYVLLILQVWILLWTMAKNSRSDDWILEQGLQPPPAKEPFYSMISFPSILLDHPPFFNSDGKEGLCQARQHFVKSA